MFIARSAAKIGRARALFLLAALLPTAGLVGWAVHRRSESHRDAVRVAWQRAIGLPLSMESIEHPRPGAIRGRGIRLLAADGRPVLAIPTVEVEWSAMEVRLRIDRLDCDPAATAALAGLAREWLGRGARYDRDCVVDVGHLVWAVSGVSRGDGGGLAPDGGGGEPLRVECVSRDGSRALRILRGSADGEPDEVRIVLGPAAGPSAVGRIEVEGHAHGPLPVAILAAASGVDPAFDLGPAAGVSGRLSAVRDDGRWSGTASGRIDGIDLASAVRPLGMVAAGAAGAIVHRLEWAAGRISECDVEAEWGSGRLDGRLFDALVATLGCRPGPAAALPGSGGNRTFSGGGFRLRVDPRGLDLTGSSRLPDAVVMADGGRLLEPPTGRMPADRLAWLLAPPGAGYAPSAGPGGWLMSILPRAGGRVE